MCYIHINIYTYTIWLSKESEITKFERKWMNLGCIKLSEVTQSHKIHIPLHIWNLGNNLCICVSKCTCQQSMTCRKEYKNG